MNVERLPRPVVSIRMILLLAFSALIAGCADGFLSPREDAGRSRYEVQRDLYADELARAVEYLHSRYDTDIGLIPEARAPGGWEIDGRFWTMDQVYWLPDNRLAALALEPYHPEVAESILASVAQHQPWDEDPKADLLGGQPILDEPWGRERD